MLIRLIRSIVSLAIPLGLLSCDSRVVKVDPPAPTSIYTHDLNDVHGTPASLANHAGQVSLIVNVASHCGYTAQYRDLQLLHDTYADRGFAVIGFPCNDFGGQEPGDASAITACAAGHGASFPLMAKISIKDDATRSPVYRDLYAVTDVLPRWNFGKYLVGRDGTPLAYFGSNIGPMDDTLTRQVEAALNQ
ncbi:MAG: glutathione peroxidase [Phycisphaerales bacterium]|nr:glutathione peroxidase [Phycisphaerales bacterium]